MSAAFELERGPDGDVVRVRARGLELMRLSLVNRGTAYSIEERRELGLTGLLPEAVSTLDGQVQRVYAQYLRQSDDLAKNVYLTALRERNDVLFYRLLSEHIEEMLPIIYTPTVGLAIQRYSHEYRRPRGVFLSIDHPEDIEVSLRNFGLDGDAVDLLVATDSEGILGIGDWGVGGIDICVGKLTVYIAAAGIHPRRAIPVVLDVGTDNQVLLNDPMYLGARHPRVRGERYDAFIDAYVRTATRLFPYALLHWEDFGADNARRVLNTYAPTVCTFNDDMQGTAAVVLAAAMAGVRAAGSRMADQRVVILGPGTAGVGIADFLRAAMVRDGLDPGEATRRIWLVGRHGLLTDEGHPVHDFQVPYLRPAAEVASSFPDHPGDQAHHDSGAGSEASGRPDLAATVRAVRPTILIGTSTAAGAFSEQIVRSMAAAVERPIILPLSNPTSKSEAVPADLVAWTGGRALIATGSPYPPVEHDGVQYPVSQANNALIFPGLGLGAIVARATRVSDGMLIAAAEAVAGLVPAADLLPALLPPVSNLRAVSSTVAVAVVRAAAAEGLARADIHDVLQQVHAEMWWPEYPRIEPI